MAFLLGRIERDRSGTGVGIMSECIAPSRRALVAGALLLPALGGRAFAAAQPGHTLAFQIWRGQSHIGEHRIELSEANGQQSVRITADLTVRIGPIPVYRMSHEAHEVTRDGQLVSFESRTVGNGHARRVSATGEAEGVRIVDADGRVVSAGRDVHPLTHWNAAALNGPLFDSQTGRLVREQVAVAPGQSARLADGRMVDATRYTLSGGQALTSWYDAQNAWVMLRSRVLDGSFIEYRRL